jgi:hypothetical protein
VLLEAAAQIAAEVVAQAAQVDPVIFAYHGSSLVGIPIRQATSATGQATVSWATDTPAVMLDAGSQLALPHPSGDLVLYETDADVTAVAGGGQVPVGITAAEQGAAANGCFGEAVAVTITDGVDSITVAAPTSGGADTEDADAYLDRLADAYTILAPRPILPGDHATIVRQLPDVGRALAIDLMRPGTNDTTTSGEAGKAAVIRDPNEGSPPAATAYNVARCTTVAITSADGSPPSGPLMQAAWALLDSSREVNFLNYVLAPLFTAVGVQLTVTAWPGYARADTAAEVQGRLASWLGAQWDTSGADDASGWTVAPVVRISEAIDHANRASSVHWVDGASVRLRAGSGAWQATDLTLPGLVPMPTAGLLTVTVKLPGEP